MDIPTFGNELSKVSIVVFTNPFLDGCREFFRNVQDKFNRELVNGGEVKLQYRPYAPAMSSVIEGLKADITARHKRTNTDGERPLRPTEIAEFCYHVLDVAGSEPYRDMIDRSCSVSDTSILTLDRLRIFATDVGEIDPDVMLDHLRKGTYRPTVRQASHLWLEQTPLIGYDNPQSIFVYINGEPVEEPVYDNISRKVRIMAQLEESSTDEQVF